MSDHNERPDLPAASFSIAGTTRHRKPKEGDGRALAPDPKHLEAVHVAVEHFLFHDGTPPDCDLKRPSAQIRKHLAELSDGSFCLPFGEAYPHFLDTLLYGKALFMAVSRPFDPVRIASEFDDVPGLLRRSLLGHPIHVPDWRTITLFRMQLRAVWYRVRSEVIVPGKVICSADFKVHDLDDFAYRASTFIVEDFERHVQPSKNFYELANVAIKAYTRWQELLVVEAKVTTTPESRSAHLN